MSKSYDSYHNNWISDINSVIYLLANSSMPEDTRQNAISRLRELRRDIEKDRDDCQ